MADFYSIPLEEMNAFLRSRRFQPVDLTYRNRPVMEWVYERPLPRQPNHVVRVYTGINRYGRSQNQSRGAGKDAIRVQVIYKNGDVETLVTQPKRVHRVTGWADNLDNRLTEIAQSLPQVVFDRRGEPMTLRRKNGKYFWGSRDYPKYKETKPFRAELIDFVISPKRVARGWYSIGQDRSYINLAHIKNPELIPKAAAHEMAHRAYRPVAVERSQNGWKDLSNPVNEAYFDEMNSFLIQEGGDFDRAKIWMLMHPIGAAWLSFRLNPEWHDGMDLLNNQAERRNWLMPSEEQLQNLQDYLATIDFENNSDLTEMFNEELINRVKNNSINNLMAEMRFELSSFAAFLQIVMDYTRYKETRPFQAEEMFYYHGTDMTNLASILKEGIRPTADTDSRWGEDIMDISPYPYYYAEIDDILPSVFVADSVEEARWWADESGIEKIGVLKISSQVENLENFHGDGNGYKTSETIPKEYIVEVIGKTFAAEEFNSEQDAPLAGQTTEAPYEIKVYVPSTTLDQPISESDFKSRIDETQEKLSELFGGFTTVDASGGYLSQQDGVISEPVIVVSSWATVGDYQSKMGDLERFLKQKKDDWGQEVIGFEFENDFFMYPAFRAEEINLGAEDDIKLFYEGIYDNDGGFGDGNEMKSYSVVSKKDYRNYYEDTKWNPCECDVQGCLSCFLNEYPHQPQFTEGRIVSYGSLWFEDSVWDAETYEEATGVEFSEQNPKKIEADAPQDWRESIITIPQSDSFGNALYRKMSDLTYNQVWRVLEIIDDLNRMSHHHALTKFSSNYVEIWIYSHDSGLVMPKDYHWAEDFNDMIATVDWQMWESETEWDDIDWDNSTPSDWGDDISWQDDWGSLRPETRPEFPTVDAKIASMLRNHSKVNVNGEQGCPGCGQEDLFYRESTGTGTKWYCYGCFYTEKTESQKSKKVITLEKYGLKVRCPDCNEMIVAYNQASVNSHRKKCGVTK